MTASLQVSLHPLGVVVYAFPGRPGELLLPGEGCLGLSFEQLRQAANTTGRVEVELAAPEARARSPRSRVVRRAHRPD